jgi:hypothetical protein
VKAIIIGPPDTPYEFGFFEVGHTLWDIRIMLIYSQFAVKFGRGMHFARNREKVG